MNGTRRAALTLHLNDLWHGAPDVRHALRGPLVRPLTHGRRRGNRINSNDLVDSVSNVRDRLVGVHGLKLALHFRSSMLPTGTARTEVCTFRIGLRSTGVRYEGHTN